MSKDAVSAILDLLDDDLRGQVLEALADNTDIDVIKKPRNIMLTDTVYKRLTVLAVDSGVSRSEILTDLIEQSYKLTIKDKKADEQHSTTK